MKLISWNVNGVRAVMKKEFMDSFTSMNPDVLCLQETKAQDDQVLEALKESKEFQLEEERILIVSCLKPVNKAILSIDTDKTVCETIAKIAKEMNILTVAVVTRPFYFEGVLRSEYAESGIEELEKNVDSLIIVPNDKLQELGKTISMINAFEAADDILLNSVQGIVELITVPGKINLDFADVRAVMLNKGRGIMGSAIAKGPDRAKKAIEEAVNSPLLEDANLEGAEGILLNVTFGRIILTSYWM